MFLNAALTTSDETCGRSGAPVSAVGASNRMNFLDLFRAVFGLAITLVVFYAALLLRRYRPTPSKDR